MKIDFLPIKNLFYYMVNKTKDFYNYLSIKIFTLLLNSYILKLNFYLTTFF